MINFSVFLVPFSLISIFIGFPFVLEATNSLLLVFLVFNPTSPEGSRGSETTKRFVPGFHGPIVPHQEKTCQPKKTVDSRFYLVL